MNPYETLVARLTTLAMGYPPREVLLEILRETFSEEEARVASFLPTGVPPSIRSPRNGWPRRPGWGPGRFGGCSTGWPNGG
ncbi:MAG: hypothetical protein Kow0054_01250 [Deferrisoma sp.]